jgi:Tfp pilus assembly protein PilF
VSVRSFRVGGIQGLARFEHEVVTIRTAVQLAVQLQTQGLEAQAETIYRRVLDEAPRYADALHLLGVVFYQKGDIVTAVQFVERALQNTGNFSFDGFHNTLGEYYCCLLYMLL